METIDYKKLFDVGERITLSSDFLNSYYSSDSWEQDCINTQKKKGSLEIIEVDRRSVKIKGRTGDWYLGISDINLYQLESYKENPEILYASADNQARQGKKRNIGYPLDNAFRWKESLEGYDFWEDIFAGRYPKSEKSIEISKENQQTIQNNNNHEIRLQKQKATIIRGTRPKGNRICSPKYKASIRSGQISYTACHC